MWCIRTRSIPLGHLTLNSPHIVQSPPPPFAMSAGFTPSCPAWPNGTVAELGETNFTTSESDMSYGDYTGGKFSDLLNAVFFTFTPPTDGIFQIDTCNTPQSPSSDTVMMVFQDQCFWPVPRFPFGRDDGSILLYLAYNDDGTDCNQGGSQVIIAGVAGATYHIVVGELFDNTTGPGILNIKDVTEQIRNTPTAPKKAPKKKGAGKKNATEPAA